VSREDDGFLSRWSRRKRAPEPAQERDEHAAEEAPAEPEAQPEEPHAPRSDAKFLEALGLKDPASLGPGDDFRGFMQKAVPEHLRRQALRRLWTSNPVLANLDGLNDYDGDFTGGGVASGTLKTAYEVGRGVVRGVAKVSETEQSAEKAPAEEPPDALELLESREVSGGEEPAAEYLANTEPTPADTRRRMRFRFDDEAS
jgi:hypothetical protein